MQEALEADEGEDGDDDEGNSALDDLDDYIAHLDDELAGSDRDESASTGGALTARDGVENSPAPRLRSEGVEAASEASVGSEQGGGDEDVDGLLNGLENSEEEEAKDRTVKL